MFKDVQFIVITGGPCSGKNTQGERLAKEYGFGFIDLGNYLRRSLSQDPSMTHVLEKAPHLWEGLKIAMNLGHLLPDDIVDTCFQMEVTRILRGRSNESRNLPIVVCGYPRTNPQGASFMRYWSRFGVVHLFLDGKKEVFLKRMLQGDKTRGERKDDSISVFEKRWKEFEEKTLPMIKNLRAQEKETIRNLYMRQTECSTVESGFKRIRKMLALPRHGKSERKKIPNFVGAVPALASV